jgi:hypothetical protein
MAKTVQLLAVAGDVKAATDTRMKQLEHAAGQHGLFDGHDRSYQPAAEGGAQLPPEPKKVRVTADEVLRLAAEVMTRQLDLALTLDTANAAAKADVTLDGLSLTAVPVGHLLFLSREVDRVSRLVAALPELDPGKNWTGDGMPAGQSKAEAVRSLQRDKVPYNWHRENGSQHHQEQVDVLFRDDVTGEWTTVPFSGALDPRRKEQLLARLSELGAALKQAREDANTAVAADRREGADIFSWLLRP